MINLKHNHQLILRYLQENTNTYLKKFPGGWGGGWTPGDVMMITIVASLSDPRERSGSHGNPQSMGKLRQN